MWADFASSYWDSLLNDRKSGYGGAMYDASIFNFFRSLFTLLVAFGGGGGLIERFKRGPFGR